MLPSVRILWVRRIRKIVFAAAILLGLAVSYLLFEIARNSGDLADVAGWRLKMRLNPSWPTNVQPSSVSSCFVHSNNAIDSTSCFISFSTNQNVVSHWRDFLKKDHTITERWPDDKQNRTWEFRMSQVPSLPFQCISGQVPQWWKPTGAGWSAFESMAWYDDLKAGTGRGDYIQYDEKSNRVWIYRQACQQYRLWEPVDSTPEEARRPL